MRRRFLLLVALAVVLLDRHETAHAANWDFDFDLANFREQSTLLVTNCTTNITEQINVALGGKKTIDCVEEPTTNQDKPHVSSVQDPLMGTVINFTLYQDDDDSATGHTDRQRIEMKVFEASPDNLKATLDSHFAYTYWLKYNLYKLNFSQLYIIGVLLDSQI